ncbi:hypothetical protein ACJX0J_031435, partial [Zea mays]
MLKIVGDLVWNSGSTVGFWYMFLMCYIINLFNLRNHNHTILKRLTYYNLLVKMHMHFGDKKWTSSACLDVREVQRFFFLRGKTRGTRFEYCLVHPRPATLDLGGLSYFYASLYEIYKITGFKEKEKTIKK